MACLCRPPGDRLARPIDAGRYFLDGRPLLGRSKTWRGLVLGSMGPALLAPVLGYTWQLGLQFGLASMLGDLLSSFIKRRMDIPPSGRALGLDQVPEALLPLLICRSVLQLSLWDIALLVALFTVGVLVVSRLMFAVGVRDTPY